MIEPFNTFNVKVACLGNHDLDFGVPKMHELVKKTNCPWVLSNIRMEDGTLLPGMIESHVIQW